MRIREGFIGVAAVVAACSFLMSGTPAGAAQQSEAGGNPVRVGSSPYYLAYGSKAPSPSNDISSYDFSYPYYGYDYGDNLPYQRGYLTPGYHDAYGYAPSCCGFVFGPCP